MASHTCRLQIETGRWTSTDLTDRTCFYCNTMENEFHFLFECNLYNDLRAKYTPNFYTSHPNMMMTNDPTENTATYIYKSFELGENFEKS